VTNTAHASATVGQTVVASTEVEVNAYRVILPTTPPSTTTEPSGGSTPGWGLVGVLAVLGIGLLGSAVALWPVRRRGRRTG
jgi:uncharacterized protein HemX